MKLRTAKKRILRSRLLNLGFEEELEALREPLKSGWIGLGPKTKEFEEKFSEYVGKAWELIFVNDGSTDDTEKIVAEGAG